MPNVSDPIPQRWALLVGINRYTEPTFPALKYCVADVQALQRLLQDVGYTVRCLHDQASDDLLPTRDNVEHELQRLCAAAAPEDVLLVYIACHGKLVENAPVLITRETRAATLAEKALPLAAVEQRMRSSKAKGKVLVLDACHTGVEIGRDLHDPEFIRNVYEQATGFAVLAGSTAQQQAQEWDGVQHGVFTYYLLEGLRGKADRTSKGFVTVDDLKTHVLDALRRWSIANGGLIQEPTARVEGMGDLSLAYYRDLLPSPLPSPLPGTASTGATRSGTAQSLISTLSDEERNGLEEQLHELKRRLHQLELQRARYGFGTPPHIIMEIEDVKQEIAGIEQRLGPKR